MKDLFNNLRISCILLITAFCCRFASAQVGATSGDPQPSPVQLPNPNSDITHCDATYSDYGANVESQNITWDWALLYVTYDDGSGNTITLNVISTAIGTRSQEVDYTCASDDGSITCTFDIVNSQCQKIVLFGYYNVDGTYTPVLQVSVTTQSSTQPSPATTSSDHKVLGDVTIELAGLDHGKNQNPGGYIPVNANNDNGSAVTNGIPAIRDFDLVTPQTFADTDLIQVTITVNGANQNDSVQLSESNNVATPGAVIRIWDTQTKQHQYTLPKTFSVKNDFNGNSVKIFIEGSNEGNAERELALKAILQDAGGNNGANDTLNISVTPILTQLQATVVNGAAPAILNIPGVGNYISCSSNNGGSAFDFTATVISKGLTNGDVMLIQKVMLENNLAGGFGANIPGVVGNRSFTFDFAAPNNGMYLLDRINQPPPPFYDFDVQHGPAANPRTVTADDGPNIPIQAVLPQAGQQTTIDFGGNFLLYAVWQFPNDPNGKMIFYPLGNTQWSFRAAGTVNPPAGLGNFTFAAGPNNGNNPSTSFTRGHNAPNPLGPPIANGANAAWR